MQVAAVIIPPVIAVIVQEVPFAVTPRDAPTEYVPVIFTFVAAPFAALPVST